MSNSNQNSPFETIDLSSLLEIVASADPIHPLSVIFKRNTLETTVNCDEIQHKDGNLILVNPVYPDLMP